MKIPRDISGEEPAKRLGKYGYTITRQTGSHMRLATNHGGEHHITIPAHDPVKIGTLSSILGDIATHLAKTKEALIRELF